MPVRDADLHVRSFPLELREAEGDGLTVEGLCVPYGVETPIVERGIAYREMFTRGAFDRAVRAPTRVSLVYNHSDSFGDRLGYATSFRDTDAGLHGTFRLDPSRAEQARDALGTSHSGLSVGFISIRPAARSERAGSLVVRRSALLGHVAAVAEAAYSAARVETMRDAVLELGEPTAADVEADELQRQDRELAEFFAATADRWSNISV